MLMNNRSSEQPKEDQPKGLWGRMKAGLKKTRDQLSERFESFIDFSVIDEKMFNELQAVLVQADLGVETSNRILDQLRNKVKEENLRGSDEVLSALSKIIEDLLQTEPGQRQIQLEDDFSVVLLVGVNGVGKTTSAAKLAWRFKQQGRVPILGASDTFRAAGTDQLQRWGERVNVDVIRHGHGADPAAVAFDTIKAAQARNCDVAIIDTAGRLHTQKNLMNELSKIQRVVAGEVDGAPHETLLVLDATTGQNALRQTETFGESLPLTGIILTKLDGTAKGGITVAIEDQTDLRVKFIGLGEQLEDLQPFSPQEFASALIGDAKDDAK